MGSRNRGCLVLHTSPLLYNAQLCPCWQSWALPKRQCPCLCCLMYPPHTFIHSRGAEVRMMPCLSFSLLSNLPLLISGSFQPPSWLPERDIINSIQAGLCRKEKDCPSLCPSDSVSCGSSPFSSSQKVVTAQAMGRKRNTQDSFNAFFSPLKKHGNSSFHQRNAKVQFRHVSKVFCL